MESLIIYPNTPRQYEAIKVLLEEMKIRFQRNCERENVEILEQWQKDLLGKRIDDILQGNVKTKDEAHKIFNQCFK
jgi:hypothetical protein